MKRPVGITIVAVVAIIYGIFNLLLALLGLLGSALLASHVAAAAIKYSAATLAYATITDATLGIVFLVFGIGALQLKGWAWGTGVAALVLDLVRQILTMIIQGFSIGTIVRDSFTIVIVLVVLWYLFRPQVRTAFGTAG